MQPTQHPLANTYLAPYAGLGPSPYGQTYDGASLKSPRWAKAIATFFVFGQAVVLVMAILAMVLSNNDSPSTRRSGGVQASGSSTTLTQQSIALVEFRSAPNPSKQQSRPTPTTDPTTGATTADDLLDFGIAPSASDLPSRSTTSMAANWLQYLALLGWFLLIPVGIAAFVLSITAGVTTRMAAGPARDRFKSAAIRTGLGMGLGVANVAVITFGSFVALF
jgi:hypothetical protein